MRVCVYIPYKIKTLAYSFISTTQMYEGADICQQGTDPSSG